MIVAVEGNGTGQGRGLRWEQVGAPCLEAALRKFDDVYRKGSRGTEGGSRLTILALLYDFHLVQSLRISYMLEKLTGTFTEKDKELILFRLRNGDFH